MKTLLRKLVAPALFALASVMPVTANTNAEKVNIHVSPTETTLRRGSCDVSGPELGVPDGKTDNLDYTFMLNNSPNNIQADPDVDGVSSTANDKEILRQYVQEGKTLPADWNNLTNAEARRSLSNKTNLLYKLGNEKEPSNWSNNRCVWVSLQSIINQAGIDTSVYGGVLPTNFDFSRNREANLPTFLVGVDYPSESGIIPHAIIGTVTGDSLNGDPAIFENYSFFEPDSFRVNLAYYEVKLKDSGPSMRNVNGTIIEIEKVNYLFNSAGYKSTTIAKFEIQNGKAINTYINPDVARERDINTGINNCDVNGDKKVDIFDVAEIAKVFGMPSSANPSCDVNGDKKVDIFDVAKIAEYFGQSVGKTVSELRKVAPNLADKIEKHQNTLPEKYSLGNYPNPFNPRTTIKYNLPENTDVKLEVYNLLGQKLETLVDGKQAKGEYKISWEGSGMPSGVYIYRISTPKFSKDGKMTLMK